MHLKLKVAWCLVLALIALVDVNHDGRPDVVAATSSQLAVLFNISIP